MTTKSSEIWTQNRFLVSKNFSLNHLYTGHSIVVHSTVEHFNLFYLFLVFFTVFHFSPFSTLSLSVWLSSRCLVVRTTAPQLLLFCTYLYLMAAAAAVTTTTMAMARAADAMSCAIFKLFLETETKAVFICMCAHTNTIHYREACVCLYVCLCVLCVSACRSVVKRLLCVSERVFVGVRVCVWVHSHSPYTGRCRQYEIGLQPEQISLWAANPTALLTVCQMLAKVSQGSMRTARRKRAIVERTLWVALKRDKVLEGIKKAFVTAKQIHFK